VAALRRYATEPELLLEHGRRARERAEDYTMARQVAAFTALYERVVAGPDAPALGPVKED
jgi:hypothetical protein